jgi:hypothetical protein
MTLARPAALLFSLFLVTSASAVDWGRLIHGAPPKAPAPKDLAAVTFAPGVPADANVESFLRAFAQGLKTRDADALRPRLSERYAVDGLDDAARAPDVFAQAVEQLPGPAELLVQSIEKRAGETVAKVEVRYPSTPAKVRTLRFDASGRLLWSDLFAIQRRAS